MSDGIKEMVEELTDEIEELLIEEGPMKFNEIYSRTDYGIRYTSYALTSNRFVEDDSGRYHLMDRDE